MKKVIWWPIFSNTSKNGFLKPFFRTSVWQTQSLQLQVLSVKFKFCSEYFGAFKKNWPGRCGKGHFVADLYPHLGEKPEFRSFLASDSGWLSYSQNTLEESFWSIILRLIEQWEKSYLDYVKEAIWWPIFTIASIKGHLKLFLCNSVWQKQSFQ